MQRACILGTLGDWTLEAWDRDPPPGSNKRPIKSGQLLQVVKNPRDYEYNIDGVVAKVKYDDNQNPGFEKPSWKENNVEKKDWKEKKLVYVNTSKKKADNPYTIEATAFVQTKSFDVEVYWENRDHEEPGAVDYGSLKNFAKVCNDIVKYLNPFLKIFTKKGSVPIQCDELIEIDSYNAEKYNDPKVVRDYTGTVSLAILVNAPPIPIFGIPKIADISIGISGGGGPTYKYDAWIRDDSMDEIVVPDELAGGIIVLKPSLIGEIGEEGYISGSASVDGDIYVKLDTDDNCPLSMKIFSNGIYVNAKITYGKYEIPMDPIEIIGKKTVTIQSPKP